MPHDADEQTLTGEEAIVALLAPLAESYANAFGLKDDCAALRPPPRCDLVLKTDPIAEGVHFLAGDAPADIGWKALAVNVSDIAAKGATPLGYLMALSFPSAPRVEWMSALVEGLCAAQAAFGCILMGGDTDRRPGPLTLSVTMIGSVPQGRMVRRGTARPGDRLFVSGTIGDAALGLALHRNDAAAHAWPVAATEGGYLRRRYLRPSPRLALAPVVRQHASAAMDLSDGLIKDLQRLLRASGVSGRLRSDAVPLSEPARKVLPCLSGGLVALMTAGDDYEILAAVPPGNVARFVAEAAATGIAVTEVGEVAAGPPALTLVGQDGQALPLPDRPGWDHF